MAYRGKRYNVLEAINILLESNNDSGDNSLARTVKVYKHLYCCSCSRFFDIHLHLLLILKNVSRIKKLISNILNKFHMSLS